VFALFDPDGNGRIAFRDLKRVVTELGEGISEEEMREMIDEAGACGRACIFLSVCHTVWLMVCLMQEMIDEAVASICLSICVSHDLHYVRHTGCHACVCLPATTATPACNPHTARLWVVKPSAQSRVACGFRTCKALLGACEGSRCAVTCSVLCGLSFSTCAHRGLATD